MDYENNNGNGVAQMNINNAVAAEGGAAQKLNGMYSPNDVAAMDGPAPHQGQSNSYMAVNGQGGIPAGILPILNDNSPAAGPGQMMYQDGSGAPHGYVSGITNEMMNNNQRQNYPPITLSNGAIYTGELLHGLKDGYGQQVWQDGSKYDGQWKNDQANGHGILIHADGDVYEGSWCNDKAHGHGTYKHANGATYVGEWIEDKQHGRGVEKWPDGAKYEGQYQDGKKHGEGCLTFADGSTYCGSFKNNEISGIGKYIWPDGKMYEG